MWIMWSLNSTIADLAARRQTFKKSSTQPPTPMLETTHSPVFATVFVNLYRILIVAVIIIGAFFVISSLSFSNRLDQDFGPKTWQTRWVLLDGWLGVLYAIVFIAVAFLWRPTANNRRLALSDELPTDELVAEDYEVDALAHEESDKDNIPLNGMNESTVFDVGDSDASDDDEARDEEADVGKARGARGEHAPLRLPTSDDEEDDRRDAENIGAPPSYHKRAD